MKTRTTNATRKNEAKAAAVKELRDAGAELLKQEDRHGETKTGWWMDGVWLAPTNDPAAALRSMKGAG
jgi:hypothetical protein